MLSTLINNTNAAAQSVLNTPCLPPQAQALRDHAAGFARTLAPMLSTFGQQINTFAQSASSDAVQLQPLVDAWKVGNAGAHDQIAASLQGLLMRAQALMQSDQNAYVSLSAYRDQVIADQRTVAQCLADLNTQLAGLRSRLSDQQDDLNSQRRRLAILQAIPFPIAWIVAEIASLISSSKTLEQQISDVQNQIVQLNGQMMQVGQAQGAVQGFANQLQLLESSVQNIINAVSILQGQLMQTAGSMQSGQQSAVPVVVEAYLKTLKGQADNLASYLNS